MGWQDSISDKLENALGDFKDEIGERLTQEGASFLDPGGNGLGGGELTLTVDGLPLQPYALGAESSLSQVCEYRFYCAIAPGVEPERFLGKVADWCCTSADGLESDQTGKVTHIEIARILPDGQEEWVFVVASGLAALRQQSRYRIVHRRSVIQLAQELLEEHGLTVDNRTRERYPVLDWTAQVGETDLEFLQRLLARHGIWFYSIKADQGEMIVLADSQHGASRAERGQLDVIAEVGSVRSTAGASFVAVRQARRYYRLRPGQSRVHQQVCPSDQTAQTRDSRSSGGNRTTEQILFEGGSEDDRESQTRARIEAEAQTCSAHSIRVAGAVGDVQPGQWLPLEGLGPCLVTHATLTFSSPRNHQGNTPNGFTWEAELLPLSQAYRPAMPAKRPMPLVFPARVEADGPYSNLDGQGRRKARLGLDNDDQPLTEASPWLRQLQPHGSLPGISGEPTGWDWPLRQGAEVLLTCLNNDPDKPLILGYAPAASQPGPVTADNATQNRVLTPAGHQLNLDDRKDAQAITLNTPHGQCLLELDANSETPIVTLACEQGALLMRAGQHQNIEVGKSSQTRVGSDSTAQVMNRSSTETDSGVIHHQSQTHTHLTAKGNASLDATNNLELYSTADAQLRVQGNATITAKKGQAFNVGGNLHLQAAEAIDIRGDGSGDITLHQGGGGITIKKDGTIRLFGNTVTLKGQSGVTFNGNMEYGVPKGLKADSPTVIPVKQPVEIEEFEDSISENEAHCIPLYPLRYGVMPGEESGLAYDHPNLFQGFPDLAQTWYTLATLRQEPGYIYIHDQTNSEKVVVFSYESSSQGGSFSRLRVKRNGMLRRAGAPKDHIALPYEEERPDIIQVLYTDTPLSRKKLDAFKNNSDGFRDQITQTISLSSWYAAYENGEPKETPAVANTLRLTDLYNQWSSIRKPYAVPDDAPDLAKLDASLKQSRTGDDLRLAIVLHDPVGIASELSDMLGAVMASWQEYEASAARAMWASDAANMLSWQKRHDISKSLKHQTAPGIDPGYYGDAMRERISRQEESQWNDWKDGLFRDRAREQFKEDYFNHKQEAQDEMTLAAEQCVHWWQYQGEGALHPALQAYDETERIGFLNLRCVTARCLSGMVQCDTGLDVIAAELTPDGPEGLLARVTTGHPRSSDFIAAVGPGLKGLTEIANQHLEHLSQVIPADDASRALGATLVSVLLRRDILSMDKLGNSVYIQILQIMEGIEIRLSDVALGAAPALLLREAGVDAERAAHFTLAQSDRNARVRLYLATGGAPPPEPPLTSREIHAQQAAWHNVRLGIGGLSLFLSTLNMKRVMTDLADDDKDALAKSMSAASGLTAVGSSAAQLQQFRLLRRAFINESTGKSTSKYVVKAREYEIRAIGLGAISALMMGFYEVRGIGNHYGNNKLLTGAAAGVQFGAATVGGALYLDKKYGFRLLPARFLNVAGWVLLGLEVAYVLIVTYREKAKKEEWLRSSYWGKSPEFSDAQEEQHALYQLLLKPRVVTDIQEWSLIANALMPALGGVLPDRTVRVFLPGYSPQNSKVLVRQGHFLGMGEEDIEQKVVHENGNGYIDFLVNNLMGSTTVDYWPDYIGDPDLKLEVSEWFL